MNTIFILLLLASVIGLVIGLVKPSLVKMPSRKRSGLVFGVAIVLFFILTGVTSPKTVTPATTVQQATVPQAQAAPANTQASPQSTTPTTTVAPAKQTTTAVATPAPQPAPAAQPTVLLQLKGSGTKSSQTFTAPSSWTLSYTYDCSNFDGDSGNFQIFVQSADGGFNDLSPVNELGANGSDTEYYHSGGQFYLEVNSECDWTVTAKG